MFSPTQLSFALCLLSFCSITTVSTQPACESELNSASVDGYIIKCDNVISINTKVLDQQLISLSETGPANVGLIVIKGKEICLSSSTLKPFVNLTDFRLDGRNGSTKSNIRKYQEKSTIESNAFIENKLLIKLSLQGIHFPNVENLRSVLQPLFGQLLVLELDHSAFSDTLSVNATRYDLFQAFNRFTKLVYARIEYSDLTTIPANVFEKSVNTLETLELSNNNISAIDRNAFKHLGNLAKLGLENNQITTIESGTFDNLTSLVLSNNRISKLPDILIRKPENVLINLSLSKNKLTSIKKTVLKGLTTLKYLYLDVNEIESIEPGSFDDLISIRTIDLDKNRLSRLPRNLLKGLTTLEYLYLDDNEIESIEPGSFDDLVSVKMISLDKNRLSRLPGNLFATTNDLTRLFLSDNPIGDLSARNFTRSINATDRLIIKKNDVTISIDVKRNKF